MEIRFIQSGSGCNKATDPVSTIYFPTFFNDKQGLKKNSLGTNENSVDCSYYMAILSMVPNRRIETELLLPHHPHFLLNHQPEIPLLITKKTWRLAFWMLLSEDFFQERVSKLILSTKVHYQITIGQGQSALTGALKEKWIHSDVL